MCHVCRIKSECGLISDTHFSDTVLYSPFIFLPFAKICPLFRAVIFEICLKLKKDEIQCITLFVPHWFHYPLYYKVKHTLCLIQITSLKEYTFHFCQRRRNMWLKMGFLDYMIASCLHVVSLTALGYVFLYVTNWPSLCTYKGNTHGLYNEINRIA